MNAAMNVARTFRPLALALACVLALAAPAAGAAPKKPAKKPVKKAAKAHAKAQAKNLYAGVKRPAAPAELLQNLRFALDHHLLLTDAFYEEKNLQRFFGNERARWYALPRPFIKSGKLQGFATVFTPAGGGMAVDVLVKYMVEGTREKRRALIGMDVARDPRATAETVVSVFGAEGHVVDPAAQTGDRPAPATPGDHPVGNKLLSYEFDSPSSRGSLNVMINGDGTIGNIIAVEEQKQWRIAPPVVQPQAPQ
jgi:hypothetical protein